MAGSICSYRLFRPSKLFSNLLLHSKKGLYKKLFCQTPLFVFYSISHKLFLYRPLKTVIKQATLDFRYLTIYFLHIDPISQQYRLLFFLTHEIPSSPQLFVPHIEDRNPPSGHMVSYKNSAKGTY